MAMGTPPNNSSSLPTSDSIAPMPTRRVLGGLMLGNLLIAALLVMLGTLSLNASRQAFLQQARSATENLAHGLQATLTAELTQVDMALQTIEQSQSLSLPEQEALLAQQLSLVRPIESLRITDAHGIVRAGKGLLGAAPVDLSDRLLFKRLRDEPQAGTLMSEPLLAHVSEHWVIGLARRLQDSHGDFTGMVYANVPVSHFEQLFAGMDLGPQGAVTLRSATLRLIARRSDGAAASASSGVGSSTVSAELARALQANPEQGSFIANTALDGIERSSAYQRVKGFPLLVLVGMGNEQYLAPWRAQRAQVLGLIGLVILLVSGASALLYSAWLRLLAQARRHQALLHTASDGIHVLDRNGHIVEASASFAAMLGCSHRELLGRHVGSWDAKLAPAAIEEWLRTIEVRQSDRFETTHRSGDGQLVEVEVHCAAVRIEGRDLIYCSARDIGERKRLARQLAASAEEVRGLYDQAPCGYHSLDAKGRFLHVNATELAWLGCTRESLIGKRGIAEFFTEQGRRQFRLQFPRLLAGEPIAGLEFDLRSSEGTLRRVSVSATPVLDVEGRFLLSRSVMYDVTELQRARDQLQKALRAQQAMLDNELIGIVKSQRGSTVWVNQAMTRIFGHAADELLGHSVRQLFVDDASFRDFVAEARPVLQTGGRYRSQIQTRRRDGKTIWVDINGVRLSAEREEQLWLLADITPIKEAQQRTEYLAYHDVLTGLPNRLLLSDRLRQALASAERRQHKLALCYLDLDGFKQVNDALGHAAGDLVLQQVAQRLQAGVRAHDTVARLGGDEFVLLLSPLADTSELQVVLLRIRAELARPADLAGIGIDQPLSIGASIGVALFPDDGREPEALLARADHAMYEAKTRGRSDAGDHQEQSLPILE